MSVPMRMNKKIVEVNLRDPKNPNIVRFDLIQNPLNFSQVIAKVYFG